MGRRVKLVDDEKFRKAARREGGCCVFPQKSKLCLIGVWREWLGSGHVTHPRTTVKGQEGARDKKLVPQRPQAEIVERTWLLA